jgi:hypothetical protein
MDSRFEVFHKRFISLLGNGIVGTYCMVIFLHDVFEPENILSSKIELEILEVD